MANSPAIPPSPSAADYNADGDRPLIPQVDEPWALLDQWLKDARKSEPNDGNAMALATTDALGMPDVRIVLLKGVGPDGMCFYTNLESTKGNQLAANPQAAICFHWKSLRRQVRARGRIERLSDETADTYFASRAAQSRISAIASDQSRPLEARAVFEQRIAEISSIYGDDDDIPRPPHWGGYRLVPDEIEFWQDQKFRMHDRLRLHREGDGWKGVRLYP